MRTNLGPVLVDLHFQACGSLLALNMLKANPGWTPILEGGLGAEAIRCIDEIAAQTEGPLEFWSPVGSSQRDRDISNVSLAHGKAGISVLFAFLSKIRKIQRYEDISIELLRDSTNVLLQMPTGPSFYFGFTGVAWALQFVKQCLEIAGEDLNED